MFKRENWATKVGLVFNTMPRNGSSSNTVWLPRTTMERKFNEILNNVGVHICLDGPTGTGKSSLALTVLSQAKVKYTLIQITHSMTWVEFCKLLLVPNSNDESSISAEVEAGIDNGLPKAKFKFSMGVKGRLSDDVDFLKKLAESWTEHNVCEVMQKENVVLVIDDFENANDDIVHRVADMCKLLTQSYSNTYAKVVVIGTGDICKKLFDANPSLEARLQELSLGTLANRNESWQFLLLGFKALNLRNPSNDLKLVTPKELEECIQAIYEAADGLPKSLNEVGRKISLKGEGRNRISPADIKEVAGEIPKDNLRIFRREYPLIIKCIQSNPIVRAVIEHLYTEGIGRIHNWGDIVTRFQETFSDEQIDNAICELINVKFLIKTGRYGDVLFVHSPSFAHTMGVLISNPEKYNLPQTTFGKKGQLVFSFLQKEDEQKMLPFLEN